MVTSNRCELEYHDFCAILGRTVWEEEMSMVALLAPDGKVVGINRSMAFLLQKSCSELEGTHIKNHLPATEYSLFESCFRQVIGERKRLSFDSQRNGKWYESILRPALNRAGDIDAISMVMVDITERKRAEEELRISKEQYKNFISQSFEAISRTEFDHPIDIALPIETQIDLIYENAFMAECNQAMAAMYHIPSPEAFIGVRLIDAHRGKNNPVNRAAFRKFIENGYRSVNDETVEYTSEGNIVWFLSNTIGIVENGYLVRLWGTAVDITARKRAEEALRESETKLRNTNQLLRSILESPRGVIIFSLDFQYRYTSFTVTHQKTMQLIWGEEIEIGANILDVIRLHNDRKRAKENFDRALHGEHFTVEEEFGQGDHRLWWEDHYSPMYGDEGAVIGLTVFVINITQRKQLENQLRQVQKLKSVGQLAGGIAHDFNNILAVMMMYISMILESDNLDPKSKVTLKELMQEAQRAANLTRQLLMFSRQSMLEPKLFDMNQLTNNLLGMLGRLIGEHIRIIFNPYPTSLTVEADQGMIEQVLMNLCVNARDAMPKGGNLTINLESVNVDALSIQAHAGVQPGRFVCLSVTDTGCGMNEELLQRIFEPFFTTKEAGKGTGLGLATVHGIVGQHKGWVDVESKVDQGTTFRIYIPAVTKQETISLGNKLGEIQRGDETILIVEDELSVRRALVQSLRHLGYRVLEASNGPDAKLLWEQYYQRINLLVSDMVMPGGLTGLDLAEQFRKTKPDLKVIISSGYNTEMASKNISTDTNTIYLQKPFQLQDLSESIRKCLSSNSSLQGNA